MTSTRCLLSRVTGELLAYPRQDDEPVAGLDRDAYQVLQVVRLEQPTPEPGYRVQALPPVVVIDDPDGDDLNGTVTYSWLLEAPPPPPEPEPIQDWPQFRQALIAENGYAGAFAAIGAINPMLTGPLPARLDRFEFEGHWQPFLDSLSIALAALPADPADPSLSAGHIAIELLALAGRCNLPMPFREALQSLFEEPERQRARDAEGRFIPDDPTTPENEAWVQPE